MRRMAFLDEGLHPQKVRVHLAFRVGAEEFGQSMTDRAAERAITHLDVDPSAAFVSRLEVYGAAMPDSRSLHAPPRQQLVRNLFGHFGRPFNRNPRRPCDYPMRATVARGPRLAHVGHKA